MSSAARDRAMKGDESLLKKNKLNWFVELYEIYFGPVGSVFELHRHTTGREEVFEFVENLLPDEIKEIVKVVVAGGRAKPRLGEFIVAKSVLINRRRELAVMQEDTEKKQKVDVPDHPRPEKGDICPVCRCKRHWTRSSGEWWCLHCRTKVRGDREV